MLAVKISGHLKKLSKKNDAVRKQFYLSESELRFFQKEDSFNSSGFSDPLLEEQYEKTKGLVHKYKNRVLILLTLTCAAYCRFCTRRRKVSDIEKGVISQADIQKMLVYLLKNPEIDEVIFSGGDPLTSPKILKYALKEFSRLPQIKIIRIGTRLPVSNPKFITKDLLLTIKKIKQPVYVGIHFEHPAELTKETISACEKLRKAGAILYSQSVFLKGVNDSYEILYELFTKLIQIGVRPYYLYRCDPVQGIGHFRVPFKKEVAIATNLRKNLSGLAWPTYVIDAAEGNGKIPVPLDFWEFNKGEFKDFLGNRKNII
ncbi:MAG TPA: KamA family radical SAM protein [Candidatus Paceibacterota bacterium]|nr:KamA family radical SAM protein [Candidatus Paceibacterota bacterium]